MPILEASLAVQFSRMIVCGPSACGKSTLALVLAEKWNLPFFEGDDFHSEANRSKMSQGIPLTADDRKPWIQSIIDRCQKEPRFVLACSALTKEIRAHLHQELPGTLFWVPRIDRAILENRLALRQGHFFNASLLQSQLETWQFPTDAEGLDMCWWNSGDGFGL